MEVTYRKILECGEQKEPYILYFPGKNEDVSDQSMVEEWNLYNRIELCNYPYLSDLYSAKSENDILKVKNKWFKLKSVLFIILISFPAMAFRAIILSIRVLSYFSINSPIKGLVALSYAFLLPILLPIIVIAALILTPIIIPIVFILSPNINLDAIEIISQIKFYLRGKDHVTVGIERVLNLLEEGVKPDDIILNGFSIGGFIVAQVCKEFESKSVYLRCIIDRSFSSAEDFCTSKLSGESLPWLIEGRIRSLIKNTFLLEIFNWNAKIDKLIDSIPTPYMMWFNAKEDQVIPYNAQLAVKLKETGLKNNNRTSEQRIFEILFDKHTMLKKINKPGFKEIDKRNELGTHCLSTNQLRSSCPNKTSSEISSSLLHRVFVNLNFDELYTKVNPYEKKDKDDLDLLLSALDEGELNELKDHLDKMKKEDKSSFLNKNNHSEDELKKIIQELRDKWIKNPTSFIDLGDPKSNFSNSHTAKFTASSKEVVYN